MNKVIFSSMSVEWKTPEGLYKELDQEFHFDLDPCPLGGVEDGTARLLMSWAGKRVFCNPPYGPGVHRWLERGPEADIAVFLLPARTDVRWFHDLVLPKAAEIRFIRGRLKFGDAVNSAPFPSMVVVFRGAQESQPKRELCHLSTLLKSGHSNPEGIKKGIEDWLVQDAIEELEKRRTG